MWVKRTDHSATSKKVDTSIGHDLFSDVPWDDPLRDLQGINSYKQANNELAMDITHVAANNLKETPINRAYNLLYWNVLVSQTTFNQLNHWSAFEGTPCYERPNKYWLTSLTLIIWYLNVQCSMTKRKKQA
jgi:hypothetical protein